MKKRVLIVLGTRPEAVEAGTVKLVGTDVNVICSELNTLFSDEDAYKLMSIAHNPYGDGNACKVILEKLQG